MHHGGGGSSSEGEGRGGAGRCSTFLYYTWKICSRIFSHVVLVSLVVAYCLLGGFTFELLEKVHEKEVKKEISRYRDNVTNDLWKLTKDIPVLHRQNWTLLVVDRLRGFEGQLLEAMKKKGWNGSEDAESLQWTFTGALFYSIIVITTIGYGHIAPKTPWGKVVTIFYAILGIPLMLLCLSNIGDIMAQSFRFLYWKVCCYMCTRRPSRASTVGVGGGSVSVPGSRRGVLAAQAAQMPALATVQGLRRGRSLRAIPVSSARQHPPPRYYDDQEVVTPGSLQRNRASQHSRGSDTVIALTQSQQAAAPAAMPEAPQTPVLFNKYAVEKEGQRSVDSGYPTPISADPGLIATGGGSLRRTAHRGPGDPGPAGSLPFAHQAAYPGSPARSFSARSSTSRLSRFRDEYLGLDYLDYEELALGSGVSGVGTGVGSSRGGGGRGVDSIRPVPIWLCVFLVVSYILGGAFLFYNWEGWGFLDSAYFCFITLTTIGFGDFVPAQNFKSDVEVSIALCSLYLLFGIALLAMSFNLVQEEVISTVKSVAKRLGIIKEEEDEDDD